MSEIIYDYLKLLAKSTWALVSKMSVVVILALYVGKPDLAAVTVGMAIASLISGFAAYHVIILSAFLKRKASVRDFVVSIVIFLALYALGLMWYTEFFHTRVYEYFVSLGF